MHKGKVAEKINDEIISGLHMQMAHIRKKKPLARDKHYNKLIKHFFKHMKVGEYTLAELLEFTIDEKEMLCMDLIHCYTNWTTKEIKKSIPKELFNNDTIETSKLL